MKSHGRLASLDLRAPPPVRVKVRVRVGVGSLGSRAPRPLNSPCLCFDIDAIDHEAVDFLMELDLELYTLCILYILYIDLCIDLDLAWGQLVARGRAGKPVEED